jgi:threonine dehydrogenase-like Zn-dependent dehydrogenase
VIAAFDSDAHGRAGHPLGGKMPLVFGHEYAGVIVEVGSEWQGRRHVGQKVAVEAAQNCAKCFHCGQANTNVRPRALSPLLTACSSAMSSALSESARTEADCKSLPACGATRRIR